MGALAAMVSVIAVAPAADAEEFRFDNRLLRISQLTIDDGASGGASGDGDGVAECGETIVVGVELAISTYYPRLTLRDPSMRVEARSRVATLVGNSTSTVPDGFRYGQTHTAPDRFTIEIDDDAAPGETIYFVVEVPSSNHDTFRRHRHIPVTCGVEGDPSYPVPPITMPMFGVPSYSSTWLADRGMLIHEGVDIFEDQMTPVLAAADGVVSTVVWANDLAHEGPLTCCSISIQHDDGWESWYIHLNNDTPWRDDDIGDRDPLGWHLAFVPGLKPGDRVGAGDLIGWVGNSGNAKTTPRHIHYELHDPAGNPVDPFGALLAAERPGNPYACSADDGVCRVAGEDRYATAAAVARATHPGGADVVYVAVGTNFPDAIAGGPAAAVEDAPILLVGPDHVPGATAEELTRLGPSRVVVLGGTQAVRNSVVAEIEQLVPGVGVERRWGDHRYATAVEVTRGAFTPGVGTLYVATGESFPDAVIAAAAAAKVGGALLLVPPDGLPQVVRAEIDRLDPDTIVIVGGTVAVPSSVQAQLEGLAPTVRRVGGSNRYAVAANASADLWPGGASTVYVAVGDAYPDALAAGPMTRVDDAPLLLVGPHSFPATVGAELERLDPDRIVILGGPEAVSGGVYWVLGAFQG